MHHLPRVAIGLLAGAAALVPASAAVATPKSGDVDLVVPVLAPMLPGQQGWVSALWTANNDVCDVRVTASGPGLTVSYPTNTGSYSSLYKSSSLDAGQLDFTALNVSVAPSVTGAVQMALAISYTNQAPGQAKKEDGKCVGSPGSETVTATLPVVPSIGAAAVVQKTTAVSVSRATPTWANLVFAGTRPGLSNFRVTLTPPAGLSVAYPGDATSSGLNRLGTLPVGQDDFTAVRFDASKLAAGTYNVPVKATWTGGSYDGSITVTVN
ncbi:hypothetical protein [Planosporangium mesophilum]|uniref:Spore coat protein U domain-containing protein n=1 Tax=Planosporangium mesophilum TaxID=689768 RepID=A0A8J3TFW0_9ACTN|nr:hypothetical protein [Planosporangium mesophilum]NJC85725.1 hypothetical protein [Planosporangium mesophilum]GII24811.1 hypothetical protein Pme01_44080 [Planosporangium mesophilum]